MMSFPILYPPGQRQPVNAPTSIPWVLVERHVDQAQQNHYASLEALAQRGGICPAELVAILEDREYRPIALDAAVRQIAALIDAFNAGERHARMQAAELEGLVI
ncbi:hypothetical protein ABMY26_00120 (plasmid) [Azospirillum sp. HJ39]|uniref:hypothetical protein n=1 Tax=Azospirillum sp. HJ39 TaxID=3159496 RepID=UPI003557B67C